MVNITMSEEMDYEEQTTIVQSDETYGFEGGKIVLACPAVYHFDKGDMKVPHRIIVQGEKKQSVEIRTKNGYDALLKVLRSKKGMQFRESLADTLSIDELES